MAGKRESLRMTLGRDDVEHIADLARLSMSSEEISLYQEQLSAILEHFERLQELDTEEIAPLASVLPLHSVMREDEVRPPLDRRELLRNAPETEDGCFRVPAALD